MLVDEDDSFETSEFTYPMTQRHRLAKRYPRSECCAISKTGARIRFMRERLKVNPK